MDKHLTDSDTDEDSDSGPITMKNIEQRSRALDKQAKENADLDMEELQKADLQEEGDEITVFELPTAEEREKEKASGAATPLHVLQKRMHECVRVLGNFTKLGQKDRCGSLLSCDRFFLIFGVDRGRNTWTSSCLTSKTITDITNICQKSSSICFRSLR